MNTKRKASLISAAIMLLIALIAGFTLVGREARWVDVITIMASSVVAGVSLAMAIQKAKKKDGSDTKINR